MAVVFSPLIGKARGSVGQTNFKVVKGQLIASAKSNHVQTPTDPQLAQQSAFALAQFINARIQPVNQFGFWDHRTSRFHNNPSNQWIKKNLGYDRLGSAQAIVSDPSTPLVPIVDVNKFIFSEGTLEPMAGGFVSDPNIGSFTISFTDNSNNPPNPNADPNDLGIAVLLDQLTRVPYYIIQTDLRSSGLITKSLPLGLSGRTVQVYTFFWRPSPTNPELSINASTTTYLGPVTLI